MRVDGTEMDPMEVQEALETLMEAEAIKKKPALFKAVTELAKEQKDAICCIADLKSAYAKKVMEDDEDEMPKKQGMKKMKMGEDDMMEESPQDKEIEKRVKNNE